MELLLSCLLVFVCCVSFFLGGVKSDDDWRVDCTKASVHVSNGKVYDCKPREK